MIRNDRRRWRLDRRRRCYDSYNDKNQITDYYLVLVLKGFNECDPYVYVCILFIKNPKILNFYRTSKIIEIGLISIYMYVRMSKIDFHYYEIESYPFIFVYIYVWFFFIIWYSDQISRILIKILVHINYYDNSFNYFSALQWINL